MGESFTSYSGIVLSLQEDSLSLWTFAAIVLLWSGFMAAMLAVVLLVMVVARRAIRGIIELLEALPWG
jgi:hypothetical protein